jgi:hypothetical protein
MIKKLLSLTLILTTYFSHAQFDVIYLSDNSIVTDGQNYTFADSSCAYADPCNFKFAVANTSAQDIYVRIVVDGIVNNTGANFQLCFASICLSNISLNAAYPSTAAFIPVGTTNDMGNSMWNLNPPRTTTPMSWTFRFQAFDASDNEVGTPTSMTYNYQPTLSSEVSEISSLKVFPTNVQNELNISVDENVSAVFYDLSGRVVKEIRVLPGNQKTDVSDLSAQIYVVRFKNSQGLKSVVKIVKE